MVPGCCRQSGFVDLIVDLAVLHIELAKRDEGYVTQCEFGGPAQNRSRVAEHKGCRHVNVERHSAQHCG